MNLIHGDCLDVLKTLPDKSVDLVLTDPPYGFNKFKGDEPETYMAVIRYAFVEMLRILKPGKWAFVFSGTGQLKSMLNAIPLEFQRLLTMYKPADCTFPYRGWLLKSEAIALFSNGNPTALNERRPYRHDCYVHTRVGMEGVEGHPTVKPLWVIEDLASRSFPGDTVLDPFMGSGTTGVACKLLGRDFIGIEIDKQYYDMACKRIADADKILEERKSGLTPAEQDVGQLTLFGEAK